MRYSEGFEQRAKNHVSPSSFATLLPLIASLPISPDNHGLFPLPFAGGEHATENLALADDAHTPKLVIHKTHKDHISAGLKDVMKTESVSLRYSTWIKYGEKRTPMKKIRLFVALSALLVFLGSTTGFACGDKFVARFASVMKARMALMAKPWAILMYYDQNNKATENALGTDMLRALKSAGLNVHTASSREEFEGAIQNDMFDVILVGYSAAGDVEIALRDAGKKGKIVPVVDAENENEKKLAKERYKKIIEDNDRMSTKLQMLSDVLQEEDNKVVQAIPNP